jgi:putative transposase
MTGGLRDLAKTCGKHRVYRLIRRKKLRSQGGYRRRNKNYGSPAAETAPNYLRKSFDVVEPIRAWVTSITYILTYGGSLVLAVVTDLFSRQVIGWSIAENA